MDDMQRQTSFLPEPITGYAAVFYDGTERTEYVLPGGVRERIGRNAFDSALAGKDDVLGLLNHSMDNLLARTSSGTLKLSIDSKGLRYWMAPGETSLHAYVASMQKRGDLKGSSFAFSVRDQELRKDGDTVIRELTDVNLFDVGPVTVPAYDGTEDGRSRRGLSLTGEPLAIKDTVEMRHQSQQLIDRLMVEVRWLELQEKHNG